MKKTFQNPGVEAKHIEIIKDYISTSNSRSLGNDWGHRLWFYLLFYDQEIVNCGSFKQVSAIIQERGNTTRHMTYFESQTGRYLRVDAHDKSKIEISCSNPVHSQGPEPMIDRIAELLNLELLPDDPASEQERTEQGSDFNHALEQLLQNNFDPQKLIVLANQVPDYALRLIENNLLSMCIRNQDSMPTILEALWELKNTTLFLSDHLQNPPVMETDFVHGLLLKKLNSQHEYFSKNNLKTILSICHNPEVKQAASTVLKDHLESIAERLMEDLPGLSEDATALKKSIREYGFDCQLNDALAKIDTELEKPGDEFDQAATIKHIRTFYEKLHEQVGQELRRQKPLTVNNTNLSSFGQALDFLKLKNVITEKMYDFGKALYGVLSDEGVHALTAKKEYTRLCRNMVVEYGKVLLFELERRLAE